VTEEEIFAPLYEQWARAVAERDRDALDRLFDPVYTYTSPDGQRMTRQEIIDIEMDVPPPELPFRNFQVQRLGDMAIVRGGHLLKGEFETGGNIRPELVAEIARGVEIAFTSVWRHGESGWRVVSNDAHIVRDS
jgi:ketosteroid isomerase-like protein